MTKKMFMMVCAIVIAAVATSAQAQLGGLMDKAKKAAGTEDSSNTSSSSSSSSSSSAQEARTMSKNAYKGGDRAGLEKKIAGAYNKRYASDKVIKVVITESGWRAVQEMEGGRKVTNQYLSAEVAVDRGDKANVWILTFKKVGAGVELSSIGESFKINKADMK
jgi:hypothetical protein